MPLPLSPCFYLTPSLQPVMRSRSPAEIARQSLQILDQRRLPPTPENYQAVSEEVAGLLPQEAFT